MADYKYRRRNEGWSKKVDTAILFAMNDAIINLRKLSNNKALEEEFHKKLLRNIEILEENIAIAYGKVEIIELKKEYLPEDTKPETYRKNI
jgi:hypothetical protein